MNKEKPSSMQDQELGGAKTQKDYPFHLEEASTKTQEVSHLILHSKTKYSYMCAQDVQADTYITNCNSIKVKYFLHRISHHNVIT